MGFDFVTKAKSLVLIMKHILMVDDNTTNLKVAASVLSPYYKLSMAKSGKQALGFLKKSKPDLILLDIKMPEMDGYQTMEEIKLNPDTADIPVIFLTADTEHESEMKGIRMGALDFITKPFEESVMLGRIEKVLMMEDVRKNLIDNNSDDIDGVSPAAISNDSSNGVIDMKAAIAKVDHTLLKAFASLEDIYKLCDEAILYGTASVCIPPSYIKPVKDKYGDKLTICTVIGFPLGYSTSAVKVFETKDAVENGADEIDVVINIGMVKNGQFDDLLNELKMVREACQGKILKVIIETCYLTDDEKIKLCQIVTDCGADYIKTSTGFGTSGAKLEDIELFKAHIGDGVKIKAAGGISTKEDFLAFIAAGCDRVGASRTKEFIE